MREKITKLLQKFYKVKGYDIFTVGLAIVMVSNVFIKCLSIKYGTLTTEVEQMAIQFLLTSFKIDILVGKFISVIGVIITLVECRRDSKIALKEKKEDQKC